MICIGIDLGWSSGASGLCCLTLQGNQLALVDIQCQQAIADILAWIDHHTTDQPAIIAVDAPTLIPNEAGMRLPDRLAHKHFGKYHAGCYPANQSRPFAERLIAFGVALESRGFQHAPTLMAQNPGRYQIEVFPHPAMVHLFQLDRILKYKKGTVRDRRTELSKLRHYILSVLPTLDPSLSLSDTDVPTIPEKGAAIKVAEDQLDSLVCAYVAAHWWYWGTDRNWVLGDRDSGYIVVPAPRHP